MALNYALRHPDHPAKLVLASTTARIHLDRALAMFDRLGGPGVRAVAERFFTEPTAQNREEYLRVCGPHYTQRPRPPEILARVTQRPEVSEHFFRGEILQFDLSERLGEIRCPVLLPVGSLVGQLAEADEQTRNVLADAFARWEEPLRRGPNHGAIPASSQSPSKPPTHTSAHMRREGKLD